MRLSCVYGDDTPEDVNPRTLTRDEARRIAAERGEHRPDAGAARARLVALAARKSVPGAPPTIGALYQDNRRQSNGAQHEAVTAGECQGSCRAYFVIKLSYSRPPVPASWR
jgi:hypothetical protein